MAGKFLSSERIRTDQASAAKRAALIGWIAVAAAGVGVWQDVRAAELPTNGATAPSARQENGKTLSVDSLIAPVMGVASRFEKSAWGTSSEKAQEEGQGDGSAKRENSNISQTTELSEPKQSTTSAPHVSFASGKPEAQAQEARRMPFTVREPVDAKHEDQIVPASNLLSPIAEIVAKVRKSVERAVSPEDRRDEKAGGESIKTVGAERQPQKVVTGKNWLAQGEPPVGQHLTQGANAGTDEEQQPRRMPFTVQGNSLKKEDKVLSLGGLFSWGMDKSSHQEKSLPGAVANKNVSGASATGGEQGKQAPLQAAPPSQSESENAKQPTQASEKQETSALSALQRQGATAPSAGDKGATPSASAVSAASPSPSPASASAVRAPAAQAPVKKMPFQVKPAPSSFVDVEPDLSGMVFRLHSGDGEKLAKTAEMKADEGEVVVKPPRIITAQETAEFGKKKQDADALLATDTQFIHDLVGRDGVVTLNVPAPSLAPDVMSPIGLDEAVLYALRNNHEIKASSEKTMGSKWDKTAAYAEMLPSVSMSYATGNEHSAPASYNDLNGDRVASDDHARQDINVGIKQPLFDPAIIADILEADDKLKTANYDDHDARQGVASDTVATFYKLVQARIAMTLADQYKQYLDALAKRIVARVDGGGATQADLERIKSRAALAQSARIEAIGDYESNLSDFKRLTRVVPTGLKLPDSLAPDIPADMQEALEKAVRSNPTYLSSLSKADTAANERNKVISGYIPKLSLQYHDAYSYNAGGAAKGNPVDGVYPTQKTTTLMLVAEWELGSAAPVVATFGAAARQREMTHRATDVRMRLEQSVRAGYTAVNAASERIVILRETVGSNERIVKMFEDQYENGGRSLFELLDAYEQLYNTRLNLVRVTLAKAQALYQIRKQMGELVPAVAQSVRLQDGKR